MTGINSPSSKLLSRRGAGLGYQRMKLLQEQANNNQDSVKKDSEQVTQEFSKQVKIFARPLNKTAGSRRRVFSKIDKGGFISKEGDRNSARKGTNTPERLIQAFDPTPSHKVQEMIDFFFMPYNLEFNVSKSMKFNSNDEE